jgi:hypothetical protein
MNCVGRSVFGSRKVLGIALLLVPLAWSALLAWALRLYSLRETYLNLRREHHGMQLQDSLRSVSEDTLADVFEYLSMAQGHYIQALEDVVLLGLLPAFVFYVVMGLRKAIQ